MRSAELALERYDTDKIGNKYLEVYDAVLEPWVHKNVTLLEIGVLQGGSLLLWRDYFPQGTIVGIDYKLPHDFEPGERIQLFEGAQTDERFLSDVSRRVAPDGFDIIIDDASHFGELTKKAFWYLFKNHLKPGGVYAIEDWGTGYWGDWPDGKTARPRRPVLPDPLRLFLLRVARKIGLKIPMRSHHYGMVGFIKQLVDEQGAMNLTRARLTGTPKRQSLFDHILITTPIVFVKKASPEI